MLPKINAEMHPDMQAALEQVPEEFKVHPETRIKILSVDPFSAVVVNPNYAPQIYSSGRWAPITYQEMQDNDLTGLI